MNISVVVSTCDKYLWALRPFAYCFNTHWSESQSVIVAGYNPPEDFELPDNFRFVSIAATEYPADKWSDGIMKFLNTHFKDDLFVWLLEDYWLCRTVDVEGVAALTQYVADRPGILRMDLTTDRLYNGQMFEVEPYGRYDIVETPAGAPYQMSLQAGIWRRRHLLRLLVSGRTPWQTEISTSPPANMRVLGTRQWPVRYLNAFKGEDPSKPLNLHQLSPDQRAGVVDLIPAGIRENIE